MPVDSVSLILSAALDHLGVHLVGALRLDEVGDLLYRVDVRGLEVALRHRAEAGIARDADDRRPGGSRFLEEIAAERLQAGVVGEIGDGQLSELYGRRVAGNGRRHDAGLAHGHGRGVLRHDDVGRDEIAVERDQLPLRVSVEAASARVIGVAVGVRHLEPAAPLDGEVELVAGLGQHALNVQVADRRRLHAEAELRALRHHALVAAPRTRPAGAASRRAGP